MSPSIDGPAEESVVETISNPVTFACDATGIPPPSLAWLKNGRPIGAALKVFFLFSLFLFCHLLMSIWKIRFIFDQYLTYKLPFCLHKVKNKSINEAEDTLPTLHNYLQYLTYI